jgi:hypothetical protein
LLYTLNTENKLEGIVEKLKAGVEPIAESAAFTVDTHFVFDSNFRSFPYEAVWSPQNLAAVLKVTGKIILNIRWKGLNYADVFRARG